MDVPDLGGSDDPLEIVRRIRGEFGSESNQGSMAFSRRLVLYLREQYGQDDATIAQNLGWDAETVERAGRGEAAFGHEQFGRLRMFYAEPVMAMFREMVSKEEIPPGMRLTMESVFGSVLDEYDRPGQSEPGEDGRAGRFARALLFPLSPGLIKHGSHIKPWPS